MKNTTKQFQTKIYFNLVDMEDQFDLSSSEIEKKFKVEIRESGTEALQIIGGKTSLLKFLKAFDRTQMSPGEDESDWVLKPYTGR